MPYGKSAAIFGLELFGEVFYKICAIVGALFALLFFLEDALPKCQYICTRWKSTLRTALLRAVLIIARMSLIKVLFMLIVPISFMIMFLMEYFRKDSKILNRKAYKISFSVQNFTTFTGLGFCRNMKRIGFLV